MYWEKEYINQDVFEFSSVNQHGNRYKKTSCKTVHVAKLSCDYTNASDMQTLVLLSDKLEVPVRYDFKSDPQKAYIKVVGEEAVI